MRTLFAAVCCGLFLAQPAVAQPEGSGRSSATVLYATGVSVGNGADTTEDILQTYSLPAGTLANVGDIVHVVAGGNFAATTDVKTARLRVGSVTGPLLLLPQGNTAGQTGWTGEVWLMKTGPSTQSFVSLGSVPNATTSGTNRGTLSVTDTAPIQIVVSGQNATNSVAGSVTLQYMHVQIVR